jgi:adenylate cyclase
MDFAAAGLLEGLDGAERAERLGLLERLAADGVSIDEMRAAVREDRLALLPLDRVLGAIYTAKEIEQRSGVPVELLLRFRRLLGLPEPGPDDRVFSDDDIAAAQSTQMFLDSGLSPESIAEITRVLGEGMARLAGATTAAFVDAFLQPGDSERELATRFSLLAEQLTPALAPVLSAAYGQHLRESVGRGVISRAERESGRVMPAQEMTVCFADVVGFTRLGGEVEAEELGSVAGQLARLSVEVVTPPARLIKTIGDAAMFVSPEPAPLVAVALSLLDAARDAELPSLRAGIAFGPALVRAGDFYGHSVNLASRVTGIARPDSVLCTLEVHDAAPDLFEWSFAGRHRLKGIPEPLALYRARRLPADSAKPPATDRRRTRGSSSAGSSAADPSSRNRGSAG